MNLATSWGSDSDINSCGIYFGHGYAVISLFDLVDRNGFTHNMFMIRNPWGESHY